MFRLTALMVLAIAASETSANSKWNRVFRLTALMVLAIAVNETSAKSESGPCSLIARKMCLILVTPAVKA